MSPRVRGTEQALASLRKRPTIMGLQVLRCIAVVMVILVHAGEYTNERLTPAHPIGFPGGLGVDIFFALSGFVMVYTSQQLAIQPSGWKIFAERRIVRIVPLYWLATTLKLLTMMASPTLALHNRLSLQNALCSYLFLPSRNLDGMFRPLLGVGYTLNYEMFFYLLFTLALALRLPAIRSIGVILFALTIASFLHGPTGPSVLFYADSIVLDFFWGMLAAHLFLTRRRPTHWSIATIAMLAGWYLLFALTPFRPTVGLGAGLIVLGISLLEPYIQRTPRLILYLGDASYSIYLFHSLIMPAVPILLAHLHRPYLWLSFFLSSIVGILIGCIVRQSIELPMTRYLRKHLRFHGHTILHLQETEPTA